MSSYEMAATVEFGLDAKQGLLDLRSESARMKLLARLCRAAIKRLDFIDRAQARARSNGKVHFTGSLAREDRRGRRHACSTAQQARPSHPPSSWWAAASSGVKPPCWRYVRVRAGLE